MTDHPLDREEQIKFMRHSSVRREAYKLAQAELHGRLSLSDTVDSHVCYNYLVVAGELMDKGST
jgi:hypothetical protein